LCGIFGLVVPPDVFPGPVVLRRATDRLAHRGPDGWGYWQSDANCRWQAGLGHRRLAIIDLSPAGAQPMHFKDRWVITFNGEIYNYIELRRELEALGYRFQSNCDTEIILVACAAWGEKALPRFRGMFAFALWDDVEKRLLLARDSFGKKPLFIAQVKGGVVFSSEIAPIAECGLVDTTFDSSSVGAYLLSRYVPGPNTFYANIRKLMPGHYAVWQDGKLSVERFYSPPAACPDDIRVHSLDEAAPLFRAELEQAVRLRLRSDAPFGAFLSGGLDSSTIVALMAGQLSSPVKTFSVGFHEGAYSELRYARQVAALFGADHHEVIVDSQVIRDNLQEAIRFRGAPLSEPADIPMLELSKAAANSVKMVLTGEGSDELLAGYPKYRAEPWIARYQSLVPAPIHHVFEAAIDLLGNSGRRLQILARAAGSRDFRTRMRGWFAAMDTSMRDKLLPGYVENGTMDSFPFSSPSASPTRRMQLFDQTSYLPDNLLERADRMMMAAAIEGRMPFMDTEFAKTVATFDDSLVASGRGGKRVLRHAMRDLLPDNILHRKKIGFKVPVGLWFRTSMRDYVQDILTGPNSRSSQILNVRYVKQILAEHNSNRKDHDSAIWTLVNLEEFLRSSAFPKLN